MYNINYRAQDANRSANQIIAALGGNKSTGMCHCPAHEDRTPSLKVSAVNGKVLVHCKAGCSQDRVIGALKSRGLWGTSTYQPSRSYQTNAANKMELEYQAYAKFKQARTILRTAVGGNISPREWSKQVTQQPVAYLKGRGIDLVPENAMFLTSAMAARVRKQIDGFKPLPAMVMPIVGPKGLQGALVTYLTGDGTKNAQDPKSNKNLRRIYGAKSGGYVQLGIIDPDDPPEVLIVSEGVEDGLATSKLTGYPAIAALGNDFQGIALPPCLEVIIAADNDNSGLGREKAEQAAAVWLAAGRTVRIAIPSHVKDWNDAIRDPNADHEALRHEILHANGVQTTKPVQALGTEQFLALQFPPRQFLLKPWLATTSLTMVDGPAGHGKTWLALSIGHAVASGRSLLGWAVERRGRVLYVDGELPGELLQRRLQMLPGLPDTDFFVLSRSLFEMRGDWTPDLGTEQGRDYIDAEIERLNIDVVILDSVSTLVRSGVDNDVESWRAIQDWSLRHRARGRAVIYLHHHGRSGNPRGTSSREIVLDARISLALEAALSTEQETAFRLEFRKARDFFGADAAPMIARLSTHTGVMEWRREVPAATSEQRVAELAQQGLKQTQIAKELNLSKPRISQIVKQLKVRKAQSHLEEQTTEEAEQRADPYVEGD